MWRMPRGRHSRPVTEHHGRHRKPDPPSHLPRAAVVGVTAVAATGLFAGTAHADPGVNWDAVAACESGGNWSINTGTGFSGGLQFSLATWRANGGTGMPQNASRAAQITVAERVLATQGIGAWPTCGARASAKSAPAKPPAVTSVARQSGQGGTCTVTAGDTLASIAATHNVPGGWEALQAANTATVADPDVIYPGQRLRLPA